MSTIAENLERIKTAKEDIRNAIIEKGVDVQEDEMIDTYAGYISEIETGGGRDYLADRVANTLTEYTIPEGVSGICGDSFAYCTNLTAVTIPNTVKRFQDRAFRGSGIRSIELPSSLTNLDSYVFQNCKYISSIVLPDSLKSIGQNNFESCSGLTSVVIGKGLTQSGNYTFQDCTSLTGITIPDNITTIGNNCFARCIKLSYINIGSGVTTINDAAFSGCTSLTSVTIPDNVLTISGIFRGCKNVSYYSIGTGVTSIGGYCFNYNNKADLVVDFGNTRTTIPTLVNVSAFSSTATTKKIVVPDALYDTWITKTNWGSNTNSIKSSIIKYSDYYGS